MGKATHSRSTEDGRMYIQVTLRSAAQFSSRDIIAVLSFKVHTSDLRFLSTLPN